MTILQNIVESYFHYHYEIAIAIGVFLSLCYFGALRRQKKKKGQRVTWQNILLGLLFFFYLSIIIGGTLLNRTSGHECGVEWRPFWSYREIFSSNNPSLRLQMLYNVLVFTPCGFLLPQMWGFMHKKRWVVISVVSFSLLIETLQLIFELGFFEFDDIFHNTLGAVIGYGIWKLFYTLRRKRTHE